MVATGTAPAGGAITGGSRAKLLREPLFWAAVAAFLGVALGVFGLIRQASLGSSFYVAPLAELVAQASQLVGESLVMASSLGVVYLLWGVLGRTWRRVAVAGVALLGLLLVAEAVGVGMAVYWSTGDRWQGYEAFPIPALEAAAFDGIVFLPPSVLLPFAVLAFAARERGLGAVLTGLLVLSFPLWWLRLLLFPLDPYAYTVPSWEPVLYVLGLYSIGVGLLEAPLWVLLGFLFLRRARSQASGGAFRVRESENLRAARRLYAEGLGRGDASVLDDLVSEDFRDLGRGSRGRLAMERVFSALWKSYPDLTVSVESQEAEGDLVRTRLTLSGTDGGGVLWYPPTGRRATFEAHFTDRFSNGKLVEHSGRTDTDALLRQLGLEGSHTPDLRG